MSICKGLYIKTDSLKCDLITIKLDMDACASTLIMRILEGEYYRNRDYKAISESAFFEAKQLCWEHSLVLDKMDLVYSQKEFNIVLNKCLAILYGIKTEESKILIP